MAYDPSKTPEQKQKEDFWGGIAFSFFFTCVLHLVPIFIFGFLYLLNRSESLWNAFLFYFGLIQLLYMLPLILYCMSRKAHSPMIGFILGAALTFELGFPLAGFGLVCAAP